MYRFVWRQLPGPLPVRILLSLALGVAVLAALYLVVFPALEPILSVEDITLGP
ncbi:hypothetical protein HZF07_07760 [Nocardioides sp. CGMCC 1.13656]|uniref:hypothetical protein n=1 Tax=Nocardioides TaxID=1839 RepID=UPI0015ECB466|nr:MULTISPECIES: hypothetical protein [unclassified Nocardioides]MBA2953604.1 hypothetical protein [Nocardioides sp. CGMCC 1.13656]